MTFKELSLKKEIQSAIKKAGYVEPSPIQEKAIPVVLSGRDLIACAQTGTGKTAAFALPILNQLPKLEVPVIRALILTPTRELAIQIFENFKMYGRYLKLKSACIYGGAKAGPQILHLSRGADILIATPGRLMDFMGEGIVDLSDIETFVLDEADRMLDMGFVNDVRRIAKSLPEKHQTVMFSATMPVEIEKLAQELLVDPASVQVNPTSSPADTVEQHIVFLNRDDKVAVLAGMLKEENVKKSIVFTRTKYGADKLVKRLAKEGIESYAIHGNKTMGQRKNALERFKSGNTKVLVATDVASRGIDVEKVTHVFNFELPDEAESYIHRIGRSGRAGQSGVAISLCSPDEMDLLFAVEKIMDRKIEELKTEYTIEVERTNGRSGRNGKPHKTSRRRTDRRKPEMQNNHREYAEGQESMERTEKRRRNRHPEAEHENDRNRENRAHEDRNRENRAHENRSREDRNRENRAHENRSHEDRNHENRTRENRKYEKRTHEERNREDRNRADRSRGERRERAKGKHPDAEKEKKSKNPLSFGGYGGMRLDSSFGSFRFNNRPRRRQDDRAGRNPS